MQDVRVYVAVPDCSCSPAHTFNSMAVDDQATQGAEPGQQQPQEHPSFAGIEEPQHEKGLSCFEQQNTLFISMFPNYVIRVISFFPSVYEKAEYAWQRQCVFLLCA